MTNIVWRYIAFLGLAIFAPSSLATVYELRPDGGAVFGEPLKITTRKEDTLIEIARRYSLGYEELGRVNAGVDPWLPGEGTIITLPMQRILPPGPREGIVINLPEHRLYFFPPRKRGSPATVMTFPVSIGRMDWRTPIGTTQIVNKTKNPTWTPPASVRAEHLARGEPPLPSVVPAGPDNPLGAYMMRLNIPGGSYLIHGTNNPDAVGMAVTHGCIRMYPEDIEALFPLVNVGTPVTLINEPLKIDWIDGSLWLEVHPPVDAEGQTATINVQQFSDRLQSILGDTEAAIYWEYAQETLAKSDGVPVTVGLEVITDGRSLLHPADPDATESAAPNPRD